jgi:hypothetical protein
MERKKLKRTWLIMAISGLVLNGFGLSLLGEAILLKYGGHGFWNWGIIGTLALVCINSGICLVVRAGSIDQKVRELK